MCESIGYHFLERCAVLFIFLFARTKHSTDAPGHRLQPKSNLIAQVDREIKGQFSISLAPASTQEALPYTHTHTHTHPHGSQTEISLGSAAYQPGGTPITRRAPHRPHSINQRPSPFTAGYRKRCFIWIYLILLHFTVLFASYQITSSGNTYSPLPNPKRNGNINQQATLSRNYLQDREIERRLGLAILPPPHTPSLFCRRGLRLLVPILGWSRKSKEKRGTQRDTHRTLPTPTYKLGKPWFAFPLCRIQPETYIPWGGMVRGKGHERRR